MNGIVHYINQKRGLVAVLTTDGVYSIVEPLSSADFALADAVSWVRTIPLGEGVVRNLTREDYARVCFQAHSVPKEHLAKALLLE